MSSICVFGPLTVREGGQVLQGVGFGGRRPRQLLALLALAPGRPRSRDDIAEALWEGRPPPGYVATLHGYVSVLRRALADISAEHVLVTVGRGYLVDDARVTVDLLDGHRLLATHQPGDVFDALEAASHGLLLEEPDAPWAVDVRNEWDEAVAVSATRAAELARTRGEAGEAIRLARAALRASPYCEAALCELMRALAASGQVGRALQAFDETRHVLRDDLGVEPHPETERTYLELLRAAPPGGSQDIPVLVKLLREALTHVDETVDTHDPVFRDVGRLMLGLAG